MKAMHLFTIKRVASVMLLLLSMQAFASIAFVNGTAGGSGCTTAGASDTGVCNTAVTPSFGNAVVAGFRSQQTATTPYFYDNNLFSLTQGQQVPFNSGYALSIASMFASFGTTSYNTAGLAVNNSTAYGEYSGVLSFDFNPTLSSCVGGTITGNICTGTSAVPQVTVALDEVGDVPVCIFSQGGTNANGVWSTGANGTIRASTVSPTMVMVDNTNGTTSVPVGANLGASSTYRAACIVLRTVSNPQTFNLTQITPSGYGSLTGPTSCTVTSVNCKGQNAPPAKGDLLVWSLSDHSDFNDIQRTITSLYPCAISTGCTSVNASSLPVIPGGNCLSYVSDAQPESNSIALAYVLSASGTETWWDAIRSGASATSERQIYTLINVHPPTGFHFEFAGCVKQAYASLATSFVLPTVALGTQEVVIESFTGGAPPLSLSIPMQTISIPNHQLVGVEFTSSGTGPTVTGAGASNGGTGLVSVFYLVPNIVSNQLVTLSANGQYLINSFTQKPVYLVGDDAFELPVALCYSDALQYLNDRAARGYNALWWGIVDNVYSAHSPANCNGDKPFDSNPTGANDFTNFDTAYWAYVDLIMSAAAARGITILFNPAFVGVDATQGWFNDYTGAGTGGCCSGTTWSNYGAFVGNRYKSYPNIVWLMGGDADILGNSTISTNLGLLATAISAADPNHLITAEACRSCASASGNGSQSSITSYASTPPVWLTLNWSYDQQSSITGAHGCPLSYTQSNSNQFPSASILPLEGEMWYENEHSLTGANTRSEAYWASLTGCYLGTIFGNDLIWQMATGWQGQLGSVGSVGTQLLGKLMRSRSHWLLIPDSTNAVLVGGISSGLTISVGACASDGSTCIIYDQSGSTNPPQIAMGHFIGTVHAWWYNPSTAATTDLGTFTNSGTHTFTPADTNDWVLVLDLNSLNLAAPGISSVPLVTTVVGVII